MQLSLPKRKLRTSWVQWLTFPNTDNLSCAVQHISPWNKHRWSFTLTFGQVKDERDKKFLVNSISIRTRQSIICKIFFFSTKNPTLNQNYKRLLDLTITMLAFSKIPLSSYSTSANWTSLMPRKRKQSYFLSNKRFSSPFPQSLCLHRLCWLYSTIQHFKTWIPIRATLIKNITFHLLWSTTNINYILL